MKPFFPKGEVGLLKHKLLTCHRYNRFPQQTKKSLECHCGFVDNTSGATVSCSGDPHPEVRGQTHCMVSRMTVNNELLFRRSDADRDKRKRRLLLCFLDLNKAETWRFEMTFPSANSVDMLHVLQACFVETPNVCLFALTMLLWWQYTFLLCV